MRGERSPSRSGAEQTLRGGDLPQARAGHWLLPDVRGNGGPRALRGTGKQAAGAAKAERGRAGRRACARGNHPVCTRAVTSQGGNGTYGPAPVAWPSPAIHRTHVHHVHTPPSSLAQLLQALESPNTQLYPHSSKQLPSTETQEATLSPGNSPAPHRLSLYPLYLQSVIQDV